MAIELLSCEKKLRDLLKASKHPIGFVPTMGALHPGHASLIELARKRAETVVVSIFVNPTQFGPQEDLAKYPRTLEADQELCEKAGAKLIFTPSVEMMYPKGRSTWVEVQELDRYLCGPSRPGHFRGVCTVVAKLFNLVQPDFAVFGAKDAQQLRILKKMVIDLNFPIEIMTGPTVRESDGLAMSSRNRYLRADERIQAAKIYQSLKTVREVALAGEMDVVKLQSLLQSELGSIPNCRIDYATIVDDVNLQPIKRIEKPALAAVAVFLGSTRLIDNITIP
jgi:pantoate--beta-alanine ligase